MDYLIDPNFQVVNRPFVLSFETNAHRARHAGYFLPKVKKKDYSFMIDMINDMGTYANIRKITTGKGNNYGTSCLLDYPYFKEHYNMIAKVLSESTSTWCWS